MMNASGGRFASRVVGLLLVAGLGLAFAGGCGEEDRPETIDPRANDGGRPPRPPSDGGEGGEGGEGGIGGAAGEGGEAGSDPGATNCGDKLCRGAGRCLVREGVSSCVCDRGYTLEDEDDPEEANCIVDENCIQLRFLDTGCRQIRGGPPAVGLFFAVDTCAGTAVLPDRLGDIDQAFRILENGQPLNIESSATIVKREVESYVTIAIDVSRSITNEPDLLSQLTGEIRKFVASLEGAGNQPPVGVAVIVFGRFAELYVPYTTNLDAVDAALTQLEEDPESVVSLVRGDGTALYEAVNEGILETERILALRRLVTELGVLTTGTLVTISDGNDTSGVELDRARVDGTLVNLISIGISNDIDDDVLTSVGRDSSFLAPVPEDWADAFAQIAKRVEEYPERAYFLAYCSPATAGERTVTVTLTDGQFNVTRTAACNYNADLFSRDPNDECTLEFFETECVGAECSGLTACGACPHELACYHGFCIPPSPIDGNCFLQNEMCKPSANLRCVDLGTVDGERVSECQVPVGNGELCATGTRDACEVGVGYCGGPNPTTCQPVILQNGASCGDQREHPGHVCPEGNCRALNPKSLIEGYACAPEARMFDPCRGPVADASCETGTSCRNNLCLPRSLGNCAADIDCMSGDCDEVSRLCSGHGVRHFAWSDKMAR